MCVCGCVKFADALCRAEAICHLECLNFLRLLLRVQRHEPAGAQIHED